MKNASSAIVTKSKISRYLSIHATVVILYRFSTGILLPNKDFVLHILTFLPLKIVFKYCLTPYKL